MTGGTREESSDGACASRGEFGIVDHATKVKIVETWEFPSKECDVVFGGIGEHEMLHVVATDINKILVQLIFIGLIVISVIAGIYELIHDGISGGIIVCIGFVVCSGHGRIVGSSIGIAISGRR